MLTFTTICFIIIVAEGKKITNETLAREFLSDYDVKAQIQYYDLTMAQWNYESNITDYNNQKNVEAVLQMDQFNAESTEEAMKFDTSGMPEDVQRQFQYLVTYQLPDDQMANLTNIISEMSSVYASGKVCREDNPEECLPLDPDLTEVMASSDDYEELLWAWEGWREAVGRPIHPLYIQYVELKNALAAANGYQDYGDMLRSRYETESFEDDMQQLYEEIKPYYEELHAYVRRKLYEKYGPEVIDLTGAIPACVLGDMWGRFWSSLYPLLEPYPEAGSVDPTPEMLAQGYTVDRMYRMGNEFFTSMGMIEVPDTFYNYSVLEDPGDRELLCHPNSWDFYDGKDYRIKFCTKVNFEDFLMLHHELGHIQYFAQYSHQPVVYRDGANDGFHEAIGELISMSTSTPRHLYAIGLLPDLIENDELDLNYLMSQSLSSLSTLPFHLVMDQWRWAVYRGEVPVDKWNEEFWRLKEAIVGVKSPVSRSPEDLDPPALYHVATDWDMIRYYTRTFLQYQFAEALCEAANSTGPLYRCDFYGSKEAGDKLATMLEMGKSKSWPDVLEAMTGQRKMSAKAILSYYKPLYKYLMEQNIKNGDGIGWGDSYRERH